MLQQDGNIAGRLLNNLIEGLNKIQKNPRMIIVIPDRNILQSIVHEEFGVSRIIGRVVSHLIHEMEKVIDIKKEMMEKLKPGSLSPAEPKIIWLKMIDRFNDSKLMKNMEKFNAILEETLSNKRQHYIADVSKALIYKNFDRNRDLNAEGRINYWVELDSQIKRFDRQEISLKPNPVVSTAHAISKQKKKEKENNKRFKLPEPPKQKEQDIKQPTQSVQEQNITKSHTIQKDDYNQEGTKDNYYYDDYYTANHYDSNRNRENFNRRMDKFHYYNNYY